LGFGFYHGEALFLLSDSLTLLTSDSLSLSVFQDARPKVIVTTAIDSTAFFHDLAYGANDAIASIATILLAMEAVGRYPALSSLTSQPIFFLANAEEWGYAGSRRFVRDLTEGISCVANVSAELSPSGMPFCTAPIYPSTLFQQIGVAGISDILAIDQVGRVQNGQLFLHALADAPDAFGTIIDASDGVQGVTVAASSLSSHLPPTPLTSFFNAFNNLKAKGVVLSGYDAQFDDPSFHSRFDTSDTLLTSGIIG
jgi:nicastrin